MQFVYIGRLATRIISTNTSTHLSIIELSFKERTVHLTMNETTLSVIIRTQLFSAECEEGEFQCPPDGPCLPNTYLCDNITNCTDRFDEVLLALIFSYDLHMYMHDS